jgi:hypothetical protein
VKIDASLMPTSSLGPIAGQADGLPVDVRQDEFGVGDQQSVGRRLDQAAAVLPFFGELALDCALLGDVSRHTEDAGNHAGT